MRRSAVLLLAPLTLAACQPQEAPVASAPAPSFGDLSTLDPPAGAGSLAPNLTPGDRGPWLTWMEPSDSEASEGHRLLASSPGEPSRVRVGVLLRIPVYALGSLAAFWVFERAEQWWLVFGPHKP
jgi:hypothetical protein